MWIFLVERLKTLREYLLAIFYFIDIFCFIQFNFLRFSNYMRYYRIYFAKFFVGRLDFATTILNFLLLCRKHNSLFHFLLNPVLWTLLSFWIMSYTTRPWPSASISVAAALLRAPFLKVTYDLVVCTVAARNLSNSIFSD